MTLENNGTQKALRCAVLKNAESPMTDKQVQALVELGSMNWRKRKFGE
ncbi:TPA: hypothetical protein ACPJ0P_002547 [Vibrio alginolyticus]|nr:MULTISPECIES: hypothetical protein [unclassified Vibrio]EJL6744837.1 hypothetical protein [Vibrio alginolyticus]ELA7189283.1 hypothetical protein [Vibrio alginolyticus]ELB2784424.1 hypothetical protein [Vibrio alginolyticus]MDW1671220.1 hypothetical protein [Vibrio sp. Vb2610]MDW1804930.1 hypothetical protein [Vibrio sp. Vb2628]